MAFQIWSRSNIIRPRYEGKIPAVMTASPYHQGTNDKASDKALYNMNVDLEVKEPHTIQVEEPQLELVDPVGSAQLVSEAEETLTHINSSYTLNDYLLARGFANLYVSGLGTKDSQGLMTNGDYRQIEAYKKCHRLAQRTLSCLHRPQSPTPNQGRLVQRQSCYDRLVLPRDHVQWTGYHRCRWPRSHHC